MLASTASLTLPATFSDFTGYSPELVKEKMVTLSFEVTIDKNDGQELTFEDHRLRDILANDIPISKG